VPTFTGNIVNITLKSVEKGLKGLFHLTNSGYASRYEWAKAILKYKNVEKFIYPVSSDIFDLPARRPKFSAMDNTKIKKELNLGIPNWEEDLKLFLAKNK